MAKFKINIGTVASMGIVAAFIALLGLFLFFIYRMATGEGTKKVLDNPFCAFLGIGCPPTTPDGNSPGTPPTTTPNTDNNGLIKGGKLVCWAKYIPDTVLDAMLGPNRPHVFDCPGSTNPPDPSTGQPPNPDNPPTNHPTDDNGIIKVNGVLPCWAKYVPDVGLDTLFGANRPHLFDCPTDKNPVDQTPNTGVVDVGKPPFNNPRQCSDITSNNIWFNQTLSRTDLSAEQKAVIQKARDVNLKAGKALGCGNKE